MPQDLNELVHGAGQSQRGALDQGKLRLLRIASNTAGENTMSTDNHLQRLPQIHRGQGRTAVVVQRRAAVKFGC